MGAASGTSWCALTSGSNYAAGSTSLTCNNLTGVIAANDIAELTQCDTGYGSGTVSSGTLTCTGTPADNGALFICGERTGGSVPPNLCLTEPSAAGVEAAQVQMVQMTSVSGSGLGTQSESHLHCTCRTGLLLRHPT